jgi:hypothetical protein
MKKEIIDQRILAAIQPQLDALEHLFHRYSPRIIGKHHPEYDTVTGRLHHTLRRVNTSLRVSIGDRTLTGRVSFRNPDVPIPPIPDQSHPALSGRYGYLAAGVVPARTFQ